MSDQLTGVRFDGVWKLFGHDSVAVADLNLHIDQGEFLVLVGPSGCGKTTSLRMLAGLERPTYGHLWFGDRDVTVVPPGERDVAMVFQNYALYPTMTVFGNLAFGPRVRRETKRVMRQRITEVADALGITPLLSRRPSELSGGQRQRVALGRALLRESQLFLLDEPLSNLDAALRVQMRAELIRLHHRLAETTSVYVTHDQVEALTMGDRVAVMRDGDLLQCDTPTALYDNPATLFVASFIGSPKMNVLEGDLADHDLAQTVRILGVDVALTDAQANALRDGNSERQLTVGLRPTDLRPAAELAGVPSATLPPGVVEVVEHVGSEVFVTLNVHDQLVVARFPRTAIPEVGDQVTVAVEPRHLYFFDRASGERSFDRLLTLTKTP